MTSPNTHPRARRSSAEIRAVLLDSASHAFAEQGFANTTTRRIAQRAGTSEAVLFRHFDTKADLFAAAVIEPFSAFITRFSNRWTFVEELRPAEQPVREFVSELYPVIREQRDVILTLTAAYQHEPGLEDDGTMAVLLDRIETVAIREMSARGWAHLDLPIAVRLAFAMVVGAGLFKEWIYANSDAVDDQAIMDQMVTVLLDGFRGDEHTRRPTAAVRDDPDRGRADFDGAEAAVLLRTAAEWTSRRNVAIDDLSWEDGRLRVYYS
ncbi:TetR/AcrR family transcriptional regulator [Actinomycetospora sp. TBRC 11914]|uniref:TetR/AcrR family transcriptional regulator n=1 Tax=Actinomycetospora sp. TBRC 11914 TaxID=2729387 RepID=UPI00145DF393|nr:TetR/AcrR family transcriptional regulator [Actinomycetospora sp. TBRC 11914]NMO91583.1 TetR/AcrR family transcriptional regulator [Actinomycetospora sp. TBRC 11914]